MSGVNSFPDGCNLPLKFVPNNPAPEELAPPKHGDPQNWIAAPGSVTGIQPKTAVNPAGQDPGVPPTIKRRRK